MLTVDIINLTYVYYINGEQIKIKNFFRSQLQKHVLILILQIIIIVFSFITIKPLPKMCFKIIYLHFNCFTEKLRSSYKSVLQKYEKVKSIKTHDAGSESSCEEDDLFDSVPPSPLSPYESKHQEVGKVSVLSSRPVKFYSCWA